MDQNFQTSFIPKKPIVKERAVSTRPVSFLLILALFILFVVLLGTGGLYFYKGSVSKNIEELKNTLNLAKNRLEGSKITELEELDKRLRASSEILSKHTVITPVFDALEAITMKTVRYTSFSYTLGGDADPILVTMNGQAKGYRSIALQSDLFADNKNIIDPVFSNLTLDPLGNVLFELKFSVDKDFLNYKKTILSQSS